MPTPEKIPPHNLDAEISLLGSLLIDKNAIIKIADTLSAEDFYKTAHTIIYRAMLELFNKHEPIDILTLSEKLESTDKLSEIGGRAYLVSLSNSVPTSSHVQHYAKIIKQKATLRRLIQAGAEITELGFQEDQEINEILDNAEQKLFSISQRYIQQAFIPLNSILDKTFERIDELHNDRGKIRGITSGFIDIDNMLSGFQNSDLIILAARPSMGKTALALDFARHAALKANKSIGIFSLEMSKEQLVDRMLCAEAGVDMWKMRTGKLSTKSENNDFARIGTALDRLSQAKIFIDDSALANIMDIRTKARRLQIEHGLDMIIIDYLQLMEARNKAESRNQEISEISRSLKGMARELHIPVIALSQLSRAVENRNPPIPKLADLRESGSIEQDADVVMFIYREDYYKRNSDKTNIAEIIIAKHRNGPTGHLNLYFDIEKATFKNLEHQPIDMINNPPDPFDMEITF